MNFHEVEHKLEELYDIVDDIRKNQKVNNNDLKYVYHYTRQSSIQYLFNYDEISENESEDNKELKIPNQKLKFRMYNTVYMNDPSEGQTFLDVLCNYKSDTSDILVDEELKKILNEIYYSDVFLEASNTYIASFSTKEAKDVLPMWSMYGDDSKGCFIEIPVDKLKLINESEENNEKLDENSRYDLMYKVRYLDETKNHNEFNAIRDKLKQILNDDFNELPKLYRKDILSIIGDILSEIRFLYKSQSYSYENEVRMFKTADKPDDGDKLTFKNEIQLSEVNELSQVPKLYVNLNSDIHYNDVTVTLGAKINKPIDIATYLKHIGVKEVRRSKVKYQ